MRKLKYTAPVPWGLAVTLCVAFLPAGVVVAQDQYAAAEEEIIDEIITTGSAIKRVDLNDALPIQVIEADQFEREGITNAGDLIETLPSMQGYIHPSESVGGGGGGIRTANLRSIGSQYTLSLLNGRRMAPADSGSTIDLSNIPLAAVERVHVLTDGASALYGSDAIAGVVNFMLKDSVEETTVNFRADRPATSGGEHWNADLVTGFGDLDTDGYSVVLSFSHEEQEQLKASERKFAETGFLFFEHEGQTLYYQNSSPNAIPGNAFVWTADWDLIRLFNPNAMANGGTCAEQTTPVGEACYFDYTSTLEILPETERDSLTLNAKVDFTDNLQGFATVLASKYDLISRIAPYPTGYIPLPIDSVLVQDYVFPYLTDEELANVAYVDGTWRALPAGNRTTNWGIDSMNLTVGVNGVVGSADYSIAYTRAETESTQDYPDGWLLLDEFVDAASSASFNIFASQDEFSEADQAALDPTVYHGNWDRVNSVMDAFDAQFSLPMFEMSGGDAMIAAGVDYRTVNYDRDISEANADEALLFLSKDTQYELDRDWWGVYVEAFFPLAANFEATAAARFDDYSAVSDKLNGGNIDKGDKDATYKLSMLWDVAEGFALRGSYGTGFKAPSMREIGEPLSEFGVTGQNYDCPFTAPDPLAVYCPPPQAQYDVFRQGSGDLQFEKSKQYTFGMVLTPLDRLDVTVDYWNIELENLVERLTETQIFADPERYRDLFTTKTNRATGRELLAIIQAAVNVGWREQSGIDYNFNYDFDLGNWGMLDLGLQGTYMLDSESSLTGSSLGRLGNDQQVVFRNIVNLLATVTHGDFEHTLFTRFRSGYLDQEAEVEITGTGAPLGEGPTTMVQLNIPSYTITDYQLRYYMMEESLMLALGVSNLFDKEPPLSLQDSAAGHQVGFDPRFTDPYGRTYYLQARYAF